ncbi:hypothetical protein [Streptomyces sp. NPDC091268]|uniref:hypothetical protein n=1 Tax=Streptomyces sp. NPDC091268 TaxID=3365979 RepID=UPI0038291123
MGPLLSVALLAAALVRVWKSPQWTRREKRQATLLLLSPIVTGPVLALGAGVGLGGLTPLAVIAVFLLALCLPVAGVVRLGRSAARLRRSRPAR